MQKINLEALESKNMTVASDEMLSEINGGHTIVLERKYYCGGSYIDVIRSVANGCRDCCPANAAKHVYKWDTSNSGRKTFKVRKDYDSVAGWKVEIDNYTYSVSNNLPDGSWFHY